LGAGLEQQGEALSTELVGDLLVGHRVDRRLYLTLRHAGAEDVDVRAEGGSARRGRRRERRGDDAGDRGRPSQGSEGAREEDRSEPWSPAATAIVPRSR